MEKMRIEEDSGLQAVNGPDPSNSRQSHDEKMAVPLQNKITPQYGVFLGKLGEGNEIYLERTLELTQRTQRPYPPRQLNTTAKTWSRGRRHRRDAGYLGSPRKASLVPLSYAC
jgi:hypothetical protein